MPQKPRRISELTQEVGSTTKQSRVSRLPTRYEQTKRNSSTRNSYESLAQNKNLLTNTIARPQRSISATPQRTPLRLKTPTRQSKILLTSERSNNKNWIISEALRINDYLKEIEPPILGKSFFEKGGIKNMSTKQFIIIVNYFLKIIGGNRLIVGDDYVESMSKIFNEIDYPHTIAKSWLKTPSAPHTFQNIIQLFGWLLEFVPTKSTDEMEEFENKYALRDKDFPDKGYSFNFIRQSYSAWNNGSDDVLEEAKRKLANDMIQKICNLISLQHLEDKIKSFKSEYDEIQSKYEGFKQLDANYKQKSKKVETLEKACETMAEEITNFETQIHVQENSKKAIEKELEDIQFRIKNQKMNIKRRDSLIMQMNVLNHELKVKKDNILQLEEEGGENQIASARLINRKTVLITKLNTYIHKLFTEIKLSNLSQFEEFSLAKQYELEDLKKIEIILKKISQQLICDITGIENDIQKLEQNIALLDMEYEKFLKPKLEMYSNQIEELNVQIKEAVKNASIKMDIIEEEIQTGKSRLSEMKSLNNGILSELEVRKDTLKKLQESNKQNWTNFQKEIDSILTLRENQIDEINEYVDNLNNTLDNIEKAFYQK